jgi:hypothetical protein
MEVDIYEEAASSNVVRTFGRGLTTHRSTLNDEYIEAGDGLFNDGEEFRAKDLISGYGGGALQRKTILEDKGETRADSHRHDSSGRVPGWQHILQPTVPLFSTAYLILDC